MIETHLFLYLSHKMLPFTSDLWHHRKSEDTFILHRLSSNLEQSNLVLSYVSQGQVTKRKMSSAEKEMMEDNGGGLLLLLFLLLLLLACLLHFSMEYNQCALSIMILFLNNVEHAALW